MRKRNYLVTIVVLVISMVFSSVVLASDNDMSYEEAKEYLENYVSYGYTKEGDYYKTSISFQSAVDLDYWANYLATHGESDFWNIVRMGIAEEVQKSEREDNNNHDNIMSKLEDYNAVNRIGSGAKTPAHSTVTKYISGNGTHSISQMEYGLASFPTLGTVEYLINTLSYKVTVSSGSITGVSNKSFRVTDLSAGGSYSVTSTPSYYNSSNCGVTANYKIKKTVSYNGLNLTSETVNCVFAVITYLN